jgi:predicted dehydrogenase
VAVADTCARTSSEVAEATGATAVEPDAIFEVPDLDGLVIATPSALHAAQSCAALDAGLAVFCQKPLSRTAEEARLVVDRARRADRLLGVDLSYRNLCGVAAMRDLVQRGEIGEIYAADLVFHNAYGPDKAWFTDRTLSGGGCVIDLGTHLVDLARWIIADWDVRAVTSHLYHHGTPLWSSESATPLAADAPVEDHAVATITLASGTVVRLACSWFLHAGQPAEIAATFHGSRGAVAVHNVDGSFYDFAAWHHVGTDRSQLSAPPDDWSGRAAVRWARRLAADRSFDPAVEQLVDLAAVLDRIGGR